MVKSMKRASTGLGPMRLCFCLGLVFASTIHGEEDETSVIRRCTSQDAAGWRRIRDRIKERVVAMVSRPAFILLKEDVEFLQALRFEELDNVDVESAMLPTLRVIPNETEWTDCAFGALSMRVFSVLSQIAAPIEQLPNALVELVPVIFYTPWLELLLQGWPVFSMLAILSHWMENTDPAVAPGGAATAVRKAAAEMAEGASMCDVGDGSLGGDIRKQLGHAWRSSSWREDPALRMAKSQSNVVSEVGKCPFGVVVDHLSNALLRLGTGGGGSVGSFAPELIVEARMAIAEWAMQPTVHGRAIENPGREAWFTEWPIWSILGKLQQRVDLMQSPALGGGLSSQAPWANALQRALGFDDDDWRMALSDVMTLAEEALREPQAHPLPQELREKVKCPSSRQCAGELYARLHVLLHNTGRLPLRDPIFVSNSDALGRLQLERGRAIDSETDDWQMILEDSKIAMFEPPTSSETGTISDELKRELNQLMPFAHPLQVDRRQLASFAVSIRRIIARKPMRRCLEWDQPFLLVRIFRGLCRWTDVFSYSEPDPDEPLMGLPGRNEYPHGTRHYWGDLSHPDRFGIEPETFDLVICPFVFEHVAQPFIALQNLARTLKPGGYIVWSAPFFQQYHGAPHDYFRYTPKGAVALAADAGLEVLKLYAPGDLGLVTGVMSGIMLPYWSEERMLFEEEPAPGEDVPKHPLNVFMLLQKPPS